MRCLRAKALVELVAEVGDEANVPFPTPSRIPPAPALDETVRCGTLELLLIEEVVGGVDIAAAVIIKCRVFVMLGCRFEKKRRERKYLGR